MKSLSQVTVFYFIFKLFPTCHGTEALKPFYGITLISYCSCFFPHVIVKCSHVSTFHCELVKMNVNMA